VRLTTFEDALILDGEKERKPHLFYSEREESRV